MITRKALAVAGITALLAGCGLDKEDDSSIDRASSSGGGDGTTPIQQSSVSLRSENVSEGSAGNGISLTLSPAPSKAVTLNISVEGGTAVEGEDFTLQTGALEIAPGTRSVKVPLNVIDDNIFEGDEEVQVQVRVTGGDSSISGPNKVSVLIRDNDSRPTLNLPSDLRTAAETVGSIDIPISLSNPSSVDHTIDVAVSGTATKDLDYVMTDGSVLFKAGETTAQIRVDILTDRLVEGGETILLDFSSSEGIVPEGRLRYSLIISAQAQLNDTGMRLFGDGGTLTDTQAGPMQDANYGRDLSEPENADGRLGFKFSKLDGNGNTLSLSAPSWRCVRDNTTGLIWETKKEDVNLLNLGESEGLESAEPSIEIENYRAANYGYTWYSSEVNNTGGSSGSPNDRIRDIPHIDSEGYCAYKEEPERRHPLFCNTETYIKEVNWYGLCGSKQWRLPAIEEMRSLVDYQLVELVGNGLDPRFFPRNKIETYYSSTPSAEFDASAWCVDLESGEVRLCHKGFLNKVRLVAEGQGE